MKKLTVYEVAQYTLGLVLFAGINFSDFTN